MLQVCILRESSCPEESKYNFISLSRPKKENDFSEPRECSGKSEFGGQNEEV